jgi:hypothetical protein
MKTYIHFISYLAEFFLQFSMIQELKIRSKQHILFHITYFGTTKYVLFDNFFPWKSCRLWNNVDKHGTARRATGNNTVHVFCFLDN